MIKYDKEGYDKKGFNKEGLDRNGYQKKVSFFSVFKKYNKYGYNKKGFDRGGFNKEGYNKRGFNKEGYNIEGYNIFGFSKDGYNKEGYNALGYNKDGYAKTGYDALGYNKEGFTKDGFDKEGFNKNGYNRQGYDKQGYNKQGYNSDGYDALGYNKQGYNKQGYDREGYNALGYNKNGYNKQGYNSDGYNKQGYNKEGYDREGYNKQGYNKKGFDHDGFTKDGISKKGEPWWNLNLSLEKVEQFGKKKITYIIKNIKKNPIFKTPFYTLGLSINSTNKEISKRSSDMIKLVEIGHFPEFSNDLFPIYDGLRDIKSIKDATLSLSNEPLKVVNTFLWVDLDDYLIELTKNGYPFLALYRMKENNQSDRLKHNLAVYSLLIGISLNNKYLLNQSIDIFFEILNKTIYLEQFKTIYQNRAELKISDQVFSNMKEDIILKLADTYLLLCEQEKKWTIYQKFYDKFKVHSSKFYSNVVIPIVEEFKDLNKKVNTKNIAFYSDKLTSESKTKIETWKIVFDSLLRKVNSQKIDKEISILSEIDDIAQSFSNISINILNTIARDEDKIGYQYAKDLLNYAYSKASSVKIKDDINRNIKAIASDEKKQKEIEKAIADVKYYASRGDSDKVIELGKDLLETASSSAEFETIKKFILSCVIEALFENLKTAMERQRWNQAVHIIDELLAFDLSYSDKQALLDLKMKLTYRGFY